MTRVEASMNKTDPVDLQASAGAKRLAIGWLVLGVSALAFAGIFAILLVLARTPGMEAWFPTQDFFRTALVVHVDQSVLIWFLAFAGVLWSLFGAAGRPAAGALGLAAAGCVLLALSPFLGAGDPLMNNYVPVLRHWVFFAALVLFGAGMVLQLLAYLRGASGTLRWREPGSVGVFTAALAALLAVGSLLWTWGSLSAAWEGKDYYEYLFWGGGHVLQFTYTQLMLVAWLWLARTCGVRIGVPDHWLSALLVLGVLPLLAVPVIHVLYAVDSGWSRLAFTRLMQWGNGLAAAPIGLIVAYAVVRQSATPTAEQVPGRRALSASLVLFAAGGLIAMSISGINTIIPAHYHGSIVGVTLALMGLTYVLLPRLGFAAPSGRMARIQAWTYGCGQLLHIGGLAVSGAMGIQRKTAGSAQGLEGVYAKAAMGVMGLGGLLAVIGGILFVLVVIGAMRRRA
jgi:cytochrome c oxidase subunit 1